MVYLFAKKKILPFVFIGSCGSGLSNLGFLDFDRTDGKKRLKREVSGRPHGI